MSLFSVITGLCTRPVAALSLMLTAAALSGCAGGFRPLHAAPELGGPTINLASVDIAPVPGRVGQRIRNELTFQANSGREPQAKRYRLLLVVSQSVSSQLVARDGEALSRIANIYVNFRLIRNSDKKTVLEGRSYGRATYDRFESGYANVRAERDAKDRAARTIARDLRSRLEAFLAGEA